MACRTPGLKRSSAAIRHLAVDLISRAYHESMAFQVATTGTSVAVELSGWDRAMNWRRRVEFDAEAISVVSVADRSSLEIMIDHRALGCGTHNGSKRPGRRRIGTMLGRGVPGKQFWAARKGPGSSQLVVLDLVGHEFVRAVLDVEEPESFLASIAEALDRT